jgi:hypothetical protein
MAKLTQQILSSSTHGNLLEAINLALQVFERPHVDRNLSLSQQNLVLISAGSGFWEVEAPLARVTKLRMVDMGLGEPSHAAYIVILEAHSASGCDTICLGRAPLHATPLFRFREPSSQPPSVLFSHKSASTTFSIFLTFCSTRCRRG